MAFFTELEQIIPVYMEPQRPQKATAILRKNKSRGITLPDIKLNKALTIKTT